MSQITKVDRLAAYKWALSNMNLAQEKSVGLCFLLTYWAKEFKGLDYLYGETECAFPEFAKYKPSESSWLTPFDEKEAINLAKERSGLGRFPNWSFTAYEYYVQRKRH
jgi:hypothetical protein